VVAGGLLLLSPGKLAEPEALVVELLTEPGGAPDLATMLSDPGPMEPLIYPDQPAPIAELADILILPAPETMPPPDPAPRPPTPPRPATRPVSRPTAIAAPVAPAVTIAGPAAASPEAPSPDRIAAWMASLGVWIDANRRYPPDARMRGEQGAVTIRFAFDATGLVTEASIVTGSGSLILDAATLALLHNARIPTPPEGLDAARRRVTVPIRYRLN
jgi:protein TonB